MMNYSEARDYIERASKRGIRPGLERIRRLMRDLGDVQDQIPVIHVAGTNGKGSVCTMISAMLMAMGRHVGRYISPSVLGYRERFQLDGQWIDKAVYAALMSRIAAVIAADDDFKEDRPTAFEIETALAYLYFAECHCDYAVVEVGMGGRLDATNIIKAPLVSVITPISMDHMAFLGDSPQAIAREKAGIIKDGRPVVTGFQTEVVSGVLRQVAADRQAPFFYVDASGLKPERADIIGGQDFSWDTFEGLHLNMPAAYQLRNAALAIETVRLLCGPDNEDAKDVEPGPVYKNRLTFEEAVRQGLAAAYWPGRFEVLGRSPMIIADGAHNPDGAKALAEALSAYPAQGRRIFMMGVFKDKDYGAMLEILKPLANAMLFYPAPGERGLDPRILSGQVQASLAFDSQQAAFAYACTIARDCDIIIACGSLSTIKGLKGLLSRQEKTFTSK